MDPMIVGVLGIVLLLVLIMLGLHIGLAMGLAGILGISMLIGFPTASSLAASKPYTWVSMYTLSVIPLFVLMGYFAFSGGISRELYDVTYKWVGRLPGGLAMASAAACAAFGACTGSSVAGTAAMGRVALPEMKRYHYQDKLATGTLAASGTLGVMIPPSINSVIYAVTCGISVGAQLIAGLLPGILITVLFMVMIWVRSRINPSLGPPARGITWKASFRSIPKVMLPLLVLMAAVGGIYGGIFTPTEGGACGAFATFLIALFRKGMGWTNLKETLAGAAGVVGLTYLILAGAGLFSGFLALSGIPRAMGLFFGGLHLPKTLVVICMLLPFIPLGMFIDSISMILLTMPSLYPAVELLGLDPIWFGVLVIAMVEIGLVSPPLGINVYVIKGLAPEVPIEDIFRGIIWFIVMTLIAVAIIIAFPPIATWLPSTMR